MLAIDLYIFEYISFLLNGKKCPGSRLDLKMPNHISSSIYWHVDKNFQIEIIERRNQFQELVRILNGQYIFCHIILLISNTRSNLKIIVIRFYFCHSCLDKNWNHFWRGDIAIRYDNYTRATSILLLYVLGDIKFENLNTSHE